MLNAWRAVIPAQELLDLVPPFQGDVWGVGEVTTSDVEWALHDGRLADTNPLWGYGAPESVEGHAERIAHLVTYGWSDDDPIKIGVRTDGIVTVDDGNHRLHALDYLGSTEDILVVFISTLDLEVAEDILGIPLAERVG